MLKCLAQGQYHANGGIQIRPNKKIISVFRVTGLKILGRAGTHILFKSFFFFQKYNFMHFERHLAFQNA